MRRFVFIFLFFLFLGGTTVPTYGDTPGENALEKSESEVVNLSEEVDLSQMNDFLNELDQEIEGLSGFSLRGLFEDLKQGEINLRPEALGQSLLQMLGKEILKSGPLIAKLLVLAVLCAVLGQLQQAFEGEVGKTARFLSYLVIFSMALSAFKIAITTASSAIDRMVEMMQALLPVMFTLLLAMGNITSAALFKPFIMGSLTFLATILKTVVLPLFFLAAVLHLFNYISENFKLSRFAGLLEFAGKFSIGLVMTLFLGVMAINGATGGVADGVALRTAKYSADLVPVIGKYFKDAMELVVTSGLLLKNALGIISLIVVAVICLAPLVKIAALLFVFKISSALIEPLGEKTLADSLQTMSKSLLYIFGTVASVGLMFFITVAVIVGSGNFSVMLR